MGDGVRRAVVGVALVVTAIGVVATAVRWAVDPVAPSTSCITGGGTIIEAVACVGLDAVASLLLWTLIVGIPVVVVAAGVAAVRERRRER